MIRIKRALLGTVAMLAIGMSIISCNKPDQSAAPGASAPAKRMKIGVSIPAADHGWTAGVGYWAKQAMALHPEVDWIFQPADTPQKQTDDIQTMLERHVDGLVILATESGPITPIAQEAHEKGVFIVNVDRGFLKPDIADIFLEGDNKAFGRKSAEYIAGKLGGKGNIVILEGIPCTVNTDRVTSAKAVFAQHPDIKILGDQPADWNRQKGLEVMQTFLTQNPHIDAVWAGDDDVALGAIQAIQEAHREKEMWVFGGAGMKDIIKKVMDKDAMVPADITYPPSMIGAGIHMAASSLRDGKKTELAPMIPKHLVLDVDVVTPENAKEYYFPDSVY
jgi:ribose transport system substrate-binding protein